MATNFNTNPFGIYAHPFSGSLKTGSAVDVINFVNSSPFFTSSKQADAGSIAIEYSKLGQSGSGAGAAADIVFKVAGKEYANKNATEVLRVSATGSSNEARIGIGMSKYDTVDSILHVKGETLIDGDIRIKSGSETITVTKDDLKDIVQGKAVSDSSGAKNAARGGLTQTFAANALVNLADSSTLVKANETGKLELKANNLTLVEVDATNTNIPVVNIGNKPAGKVLMTGSLDVSGSSVFTGSFTTSGSVFLDGATTVTDILNAIAGFEVSGSTNISGSVVMRDISSQGAGAYFEHSGLSSGGSLLLKLGDIDSLGTGNGTKIIIDDANENITITGSLDVTGNQIDFTSLPTSDPGVAGRLYQTASAAMGMTAGKQVVLISA